MKRIGNKLIRGEKGQALIITTILLLVGGLVITPLLGFMSTGLIAGQVFEKKMDGLYAADAGIEDALWKLLNGYYSPPHTLTDVNGMHVTVVELGQEPTADGTLYTLQSTASLGGEIKTEIVAQVEAVFQGAVATGGTGGDYTTNPEMVALSLIDKDSMIFTTQQPNARFQGWGESSPGAPFGQDDLWSLNMATGTGTLYLDGDDVMTNPKYKINGVHYYYEVGGLDYLLMTIETTQDVGTPPVAFTNNDIFKLHIDPLDPQQWEAEPVYTIPGVDIVALSGRGIGDNEPANDIILFSLHTDTTLGGTEFHRGEVIEFNPNTGGYSLEVDANAILGPLGNPNLEFDCIAVLPAPDERLLLSFTVDGVTGSNGETIKSQDITIWDPGPDGIANTADDTINLHISMSGRLWPAGEAASVNIISWEIS